MKSDSKMITFLVVVLLSTITIGMAMHKDVQKSKTVSLEAQMLRTIEESNQIKKEAKKVVSKEVTTTIEEVAVANPEPKATPTPEPTVTQDPVVYDGLTMNELASKLDRSLGSTLAGTGYTFASKSIALGLDPYLAVAIVLHETGCQWECSYLVQACNNVGGMKGSPGCGGGSYMAFSSLDEGIESYLNNLYHNYYAQGLTTPETIGPRYAASSTWSSKINWYISAIKAK